MPFTGVLADASLRPCASLTWADAMGKRSSFERIPRDFYPTPSQAVLPLIPHLRLRRVRTFAEPCCGDGALVRHLEAYGLRCTYAGDIADGRDALATTDYGGPDLIITNPPWSRRILHPLISHFQAIAPTWLLVDQDWCCTKQVVPYLSSCTDIITIGRVQWIPGSKYKGGKDNSAWYRFDARHSAVPIFHPFRSALVAPRSRLCQQCGKPYQPQRSDSKVCSDACRQRAYRDRVSVT